MPKILSIIFAFMCVLFVGCDSSDKSPSIATTSPSAVESAGTLLDSPALKQGSIIVGIRGRDFDDALLSSARKALPEEILTNEIEEALQAGLWNSNQTAVAISIPGPGSETSLLFVFLLQNKDNYLSVDVSGMEGANIGFIGPDRIYDRVETKPLKWLSRKDGLFQIQMQTHAWHSGQRYTGTGNRVIKPDGTYISQ